MRGAVVALCLLAASGAARAEQIPYPEIDLELTFGAVFAKVGGVAGGGVAGHGSVGTHFDRFRFAIEHSFGAFTETAVGEDPRRGWFYRGAAVARAPLAVFKPNDRGRPIGGLFAEGAVGFELVKLGELSARRPDLALGLAYHLGFYRRGHHAGYHLFFRFVVAPGADGPVSATCKDCGGGPSTDYGGLFGLGFYYGR